MNHEIQRLQEDYRAALMQFIEDETEALLSEAYELGRRALKAELGVIGIAGIHLRALESGFHHESRPLTLAELRSAELFFTEALSPFEMIHRGRVEANAALHRINDILEEEARRIALTLHAEAGQLLATAFLDLAETERDIPAARGHIRKIREHLDQMREQLRQMSHELHPPMLDDLGLIPALRSLAEGISRRTGLTVNVEGVMAERPSRATELALYRIAQEALNNVLRHAQATQADIRLAYDGEQIKFSIEDNGAGFDVGEAEAKTGDRGVGLTAIQERLAPLHGTFHIVSLPGQGTEVLVTIPLPPRVSYAHRIG
jgi:signal transduction histidine kinase